MVTKKHKRGNYTIVEIEDEFTVLTDLNEFKDMLEEMILEDNVHIAIRFKNISYIYSGPLGILARLIMDVKKNGGKLVLLEPNHQVSEILCITNLDKMLIIIKSEEELLKL